MNAIARKVNATRLMDHRFNTLVTEAEVMASAIEQLVVKGEWEDRNGISHSDVRRQSHFMKIA